MFDSEIFAQRRAAVMQSIGPRAALLVCSLPERVRNNDAHYPFRQHSDVMYLTGFREPQTVVLMRPQVVGSNEQFVMFVRPRDPEMETWDGRRAGIEGAVATYGADVAYPIAELAAKLPALIANFDELHFALGLDEKMDHIVTAALAGLRNREKRGQQTPRAVVDPRYSLHEARLRKQPDEIECLQRAAKISSDAHIAAMKLGRPGQHEHQLEAEIVYEFRRSGGTGPGYTPIVGAGANATILHYVENCSAIHDGDLVLVDAGCEVDGYTADITRTWPANGTFSAAQRRVYDAVLAVQKSAIALVKPGATIEEIHNHCVRGLTTAMIDLGLLSGLVDERITDNSYRKFYMHGTSHWLGLDVHDAGPYLIAGKARPLQSGMVITVEPGLYVAVDAADVPIEMRGIGVRIEDDILVTSDGHRNLTAQCPKEVADIELLCRNVG
jgi:Xaa-Pro aminopeptidase